MIGSDSRDEHLGLHQVIHQRAPLAYHVSIQYALVKCVCAVRNQFLPGWNKAGEKGGISPVQH
jgi:hypothetical protein